MRFIKMTGIGNDYVYVDCFDQTVEHPARLAQIVSNRNFGIGSDGLILIHPPDEGVDAAARMQMFNMDGSEGQMCGNGIRCVCKMVRDHRLGEHHEQNPMRIQTACGVLSLAYELDSTGRVGTVSVDMGHPILEPKDVPVDPEEMTETGQPQTFKLSVPGTTERFDATFVSMGNPHAVIFVDEVSDETGDVLRSWGQALEHHPAFPERMNIHFVEVVDDSSVKVLHWERGSGPTLACGTGACAVCVAGVLTDRTQTKITAQLPGGPLELEWRYAEADETGPVVMTGPATEVFTGDWPS
ncbi:MAG: diaminopimelate epimerase [Phycisphaeraceae bacterium]